MAASKAKGEVIKAAYARGATVRNRHINETGVVHGIYVNDAGTWYDMVTKSGMSIGWWYESDIDGATRSRPPETKREGGTPA